MPFDSMDAAVFPKPTEEMKSHLKPLFIKAKAEGKVIKRVLIDGGAAINLIPEHVVQKLDKTLSDIMPHNMIITDFNGKTSKSPGCIALDLKVGSITRTTMLVIVPSKANYNILLGREWIHGVGAVPSTLHQMLFMWDDKGRIEFVRGDEDYFRCEVNNADFDRNLSNIEPMSMPSLEEFYVQYPAQVQLSPTGLNVNQTCDCSLAARVLRDAGISCEVLNLEEDYGSMPSLRTSYSQVLEYNADSTVEDQEEASDSRIRLPVPREMVSYPDIQPTGWDV